MRAASRVLGLVLVCGLTTLPLAAQDADLTAALELERQGRPAEAADRFIRVLAVEPTHPVALLGLERTLRVAGTLDRVFEHVERALAVRPDEPVAHGVNLRSLSALGRDADVGAAAERWIAAAPGAAEPYREWAFVVAQGGDYAAARAILEQGRASIGGAALRPELAQLAVASGRWVDAARHWHAAALANASYVGAAGLTLSQARDEQRPAVLHLLLGELGDTTARWIAADALVGWGRAGEGWALLDATLPSVPLEASAMLRRFADRARVVGTPEGARVRGHALERLASRQTGGAAQRTRIEAARAFAEAGDRPAAERMLGEIARDPSNAPPGTGDALAALIVLMADAGRAADAERRLDEWRRAIPESEREQLRRRIARAWAREGAFAHADSLLGSDSTVEAASLRGWLALYRGDLGSAVQQFREAGPYAGSREEATRRTVAAALAQRLGPGAAPPVGRAFHALERGDTVAAIGAFAAAADAFPAAAGRGDLLAFAGQLALRRGDARAESLFTAALAADTVGPAAPVAELGLAELAWQAGRPEDARRRLERIILAHPASAVVPEARRLLDRVRGGVPNS
jgi:tetratricopeptide (TPR) repeat protein